MSTIRWVLCVGCGFSGDKTAQVELKSGNWEVVNGPGLWEGIITAPGKGSMVFTFDNTYSYLTSKKVRYRTLVMEASPGVEAGGGER